MAKTDGGTAPSVGLVLLDGARGEMRPVDAEHALFSVFEILSGYFSITPKIAGIFFDDRPYSQDMLERRKLHVVDVIRRLLVPDDPAPG